MPLFTAPLMPLVALVTFQQTKSHLHARHATVQLHQTPLQSTRRGGGAIDPLDYFHFYNSVYKMELNLRAHRICKTVIYLRALKSGEPNAAWFFERGLQSRRGARRRKKKKRKEKDDGCSICSCVLAS